MTLTVLTVSMTVEQLAMEVKSAMPYGKRHINLLIATVKVAMYCEIR